MEEQDFEVQAIAWYTVRANSPEEAERKAREEARANQSLAAEVCEFFAKQR